jgi:hypothetical protein
MVVYFKISTVFVKISYLLDLVDTKVLLMTKN